MMTWRRGGGGGGEPKYDMMTRGRGGSGYLPKMMTSFMNSPLELLAELIICSNPNK